MSKASNLIDMIEGSSSDQKKLEKLAAEAKTLNDYLFNAGMPNMDKALKKIKAIAKKALKLDNVLVSDDKKKIEDLAKGKLPSGGSQNPVMAAAITLAATLAD